MKEDIKFIDIQYPHYSKIIEVLIASYNEKENIDRIEILLYLGNGKKSLKIILRPENKMVHLNAVYSNAIFNVTTPLHSEAEAEVYLGKAQIIPKPKTENPANSTSHYSLNIELVEEFTAFTESFIKKIRVLKDELGVAKETLRLTGDIFHILPDATKSFNVVRHEECKCFSCLTEKDIRSMFKIQDLSRKSKTIHGDGSGANYKEQKVFISSHVLESDAIRAVEEWTRKLNKNRDNGDLLIKRGTNLINFGFIHDFKIKTDFKYATYSTKIYSIYANIKINTTGTKDYKLTEKDMQEAVICSLEKLDPKKVSAGENNPAESISTPKATETIVVPFSIALKGIVVYSHLLSYINHYKATFRFKNKEFKGEIKSINIQDSSTTTANARYTSPSSVKAIVNIAITQECKDTIDNLIEELDSREICVGSLGFHSTIRSGFYSINKSAGALYTIKSYAEKEDRQTINIDMSLNAVVGLERFSHLVNKYANLPFTVSTDNEQVARIIYCADTEEEAVNLIMKIKDKLKNRFIENKSKQSDFTIYNNYINVEIKSFSSGIVNIYADSTILKVQDVVLVASRVLGKYFVVAKLH